MAVKNQVVEMKNQETMEVKSKRFCCISQMLTQHMPFNIKDFRSSSRFSVLR